MPEAYPIKISVSIITLNEMKAASFWLACAIHPEPNSLMEANWLQHLYLKMACTRISSQFIFGDNGYPARPLIRDQMPELV